MNIGYHQSTASGLPNMVEEAIGAGGNTFAFFTRNPRTIWVSAPLPTAAADALQKELGAHNFAPLVIHAPYTANPCSDDSAKRDKACEVLHEDVDFLREHLAGNFYNFHPGSHKGQGVKIGVQQTAHMLCEVLTPSDLRCVVLIETMAGKGNEIGRNFDEVRAIIDETEATIGQITQDTLGVCLDTCHIWDAGYDLHDLDKVLTEFDNIIGLKRLRAIHLNDSKNPLGSHKDRHELLGKGCIGLDALIEVAKFANKRELPIILETPNTLAGWAQEIALVKSRC